MVYKAGVCRRLLNLTMQEYLDKPRFFDKSISFNKTDAIITEFMKVIKRIDDHESKCNLIELQSLMCEYMLPPCDDQGKPRVYCREDCDELFRQCSGAMKEILGAVKYMTDKEGIEFVHAGFPNCTRHKYSEQYDKENNETCLHFGIYGEYYGMDVLFAFFASLFLCIFLPPCVQLSVTCLFVPLSVSGYI